MKYQSISADLKFAPREGEDNIALANRYYLDKVNPTRRKLLKPLIIDRLFDQSHWNSSTTAGRTGINNQFLDFSHEIGYYSTIPDNTIVLPHSEPQQDIKEGEVNYDRLNDRVIVKTSTPEPTSNNLGISTTIPLTRLEATKNKDTIKVKQLLPPPLPSSLSPSSDSTLTASKKSKSKLKSKSKSKSKSKPTTIEKYEGIEEAPKVELIDPRLTGHGDNSRHFIHPITGNPKWDYRDIDSRYNPYLTRNHLDIFPFGEHLGDGSTSQSLQQIRHLAEHNFIDQLNSHREHMQISLMRNYNNNVAWQRKAAPIRTF